MRAERSQLLPTRRNVCPHVLLRVWNDNPEHPSRFQHPVAGTQECGNLFMEVEVFEKMLSKYGPHRTVRKRQVPSAIEPAVHVFIRKRIDVHPTRLPLRAASDIHEHAPRMLE